MPRRRRRPEAEERVIEQMMEHVMSCLEDQDAKDIVLDRFSESSIREAVEIVYDRLKHHGMEPDQFDWCEFTELTQFESIGDFIRDLEERGVLPPPSAEERSQEILERMVHEYKRELESLGYKVLDEASLRRIMRDAREAERLKRELAELNRRLKLMEEMMKRFMVQLPPPEKVKEEIEKRLGIEIEEPKVITWGEIKAHVIYALHAYHSIPWTSAVYLVRILEPVLAERYEEVRALDLKDVASELADTVNETVMRRGVIMSYRDLTMSQVEVRNPKPAWKRTPYGAVLAYPPTSEVYSRILTWARDLETKQGYTTSEEPIELRHQAVLIVPKEVNPETVECLVLGVKIIACNTMAAGYNYFEVEKRVIHAHYDRSKRLRV